MPHKTAMVRVRLHPQQLQKLEQLSEQTFEPGNLSLVVRQLIDATEQLPKLTHIEQKNNESIEDCQVSLDALA